MTSNYHLSRTPPLNLEHAQELNLLAHETKQGICANLILDVSSSSYNANLAVTLLQTTIEEFRAMPMHMKISSRIEDALSWCEELYSSTTGTHYRWETETDQRTRQRLR